MIKIGFCDDDLSVLNEISSLLDQYRVQQNREIEYTAYNSPLELLAGIERGIRFDILFLDVLMPGENGMDAAREIRGWDNTVKIIFLTSSAEFAVQSYEVGAYFYQLKPIWKDSFFRLLDSVLSECAKARTESLILKCKEGITRVDLKKLEYCEVIGRTLLIHLTTGQVLESSGILDELTERLMGHGNFLRLHRSYLINMEYIQSISYRAVTMSSLVELPIPRGKYTEVKNAFLNHSFKAGQGMISGFGCTVSL